MKTLAIIPARLQSSRLPNKMLSDLAGKPLIVRVWENVQSFQLFDKVIVATDAVEIEEVLRQHNIDICMTAQHHASGFDRIGEVLQKETDYSIVVNVQGDEPFIEKTVLESLIQLMRSQRDLAIGTVAVPITSLEEFQNPNAVKVTVNQNHEALYFSRSAIPCNRDNPGELPEHAYRHLGVYAYRYDQFAEIKSLAQSYLENTEKLEQLRFLEAGYKIGVTITKSKSIGIDTAADLELARERLKTSAH